ncbi:hypothetical protein [Sutcliffiella horikoshii]|uniref:Uncharacterized protein n=1 Tax=Sutcliffiella horikoshii TaxID=79883 RepID=A0A5D4T501_9BACI|nr:hypothetical protein [Sutcliffiella horikoshii]TYS69991.1 hypothetical protein FZC75_15225 [Sutcliffiella horikoshii]
MKEIINFSEIIFDNSLIMAMIAINMTIIGLTSLAESKSIIGIDYGKFLVRKYKVLNIVKIYHLLIAFAIINVSSLFLMFVQTYQFRIIIFTVLILSLIFAIFYFFAYIIVENRWVKKQIYEQELLGLYYSSNEVTTFKVDLLVNIKDGSRTHKKLSGNIITYFNKVNSDTQEAFEEIFGPTSIIYDDSAKTIKRRTQKFGKPPYIYRSNETKDIHDISFEFFQLFRFTSHQDKWALEILRLFEGENNGFDIMRLYNFSRVITQVNVFGSSDAIYKYKFLEYMINHYYKAVSMTDEEKHHWKQNKHLREVELHTIQQIYTYMANTIIANDNNPFKHATMLVLKNIILRKKYAGTLSDAELLYTLLDIVLETDNKVLKQMFTEMLQTYYEQTPSHKVEESLSDKNIKIYIKDFKVKSKLKEKISVEALFG